MTEKRSQGGRGGKSKHLKKAHGTLRNTVDVVPRDHTVDESDFPVPPFELNDRAMEFYKEVARHLNESKVLYKVDAVVIGMFAKNLDILVTSADQLQTISDFVQTFENGSSNITGTFTAFDKASSNILKLSAKLGLSPADREKLMSFAKVKDDESSPYDQLKLHGRTA